MSNLKKSYDILPLQFEFIQTYTDFYKLITIINYLFLFIRRMYRT